MTKSIFVLLLAKVNRKPVSDLFIRRGSVDRLFHEGFDRKIIVVDLAILYETSPRNFGHLDSQAKLILSVAELCMETHKLLS